MEVNDLSNVIDDEISLKELFQVIHSKILVIFSIIFITFSISFIYAFSTPDKYISSALLVSPNGSNSLNSSLGELSGLAGMAGFSLPQESGNKLDESIERIKSFHFFSKNFLPYINLQDLVAAENWDKIQNKVIYDSDIFDSSKNKWVRKADIQKKIVPSNQEAYKKYKEILTIDQDKKTNFILLSIEHFSPNLAKDWVDLIIKNINLEMSLIDQRTSSESINFLNENLKKTNTSELKQVIFNLLEKQIQNLMLSSSSKDYAFTTIQPSIAEEEKASPNRLFILIIGLILGIFTSLGFAIVPHYWKKSII